MGVFSRPGEDDPHPTAFAPLWRSTSPFQGEVGPRHVPEFDDSQRRLPRRSNRNIIHGMKYPLPAIVRLGVRPDPPADDPAAIVGPRPRGSRRPHTDAKVAAVRRLIEQTVLTYGEIAAKTGVGRASICRWTRDGQWQRPLFAPRATDTVPSRPRRRAAEAAHAVCAPRRARGALYPRARSRRERRSRQARRGAGASQDGEARRPPATAQAARGHRRRRTAAWDAVRARWSGACAPPASTPSARRRKRSWTSSQAARRRPRNAASAAGASPAPTITPG